MNRPLYHLIALIIATIVVVMGLCSRSPAAEVIANRVAETTATTGTGTLSLAGAKSGYQTFVAGCGSGNTCTYLITDGTDWEIGTGTVTDASPDTLSRDSVEDSSNNGEKVNWGAGSKDVHNVLTAATISSFSGPWGSATEKTIASGAVSIAAPGYYTVDTEGDTASDDLTTITGLTAGDEVLLTPAHTDRTIVVTSGAGLLMPADFIMNNTADRIRLQCIGSNVCVELSRASGGD